MWCSQNQIASSQPNCSNLQASFHLEMPFPSTRRTLRMLRRSLFLTPPPSRSLVLMAGEEVFLFSLFLLFNFNFNSFCFFLFFFLLWLLLCAYCLMQVKLTRRMMMRDSNAARAFSAGSNNNYNNMLVVLLFIFFIFRVIVRLVVYNHESTRIIVVY